MGRGCKKHLKRLNVPKKWMLDKRSGKFAPKPSPGPHKKRECLPLAILIRNRLKYAQTYNEVISIVKRRLIKIDGKIRTDKTFPVGVMDVLTIDKCNENFRLIYDVKGRFTLHRISNDEAKYKLCRVKKVGVGHKGVPYCITHDGRTIPYVDPGVKTHDSIRFELETSRPLDFLKFENGQMALITGGHNIGRVGVVVNREKHPGSFDIVHLKDTSGVTFATRLSNVFIIGTDGNSWVSLPRGKGVKISIAEERAKRISRKPLYI
ncbi:hypothetical protein A3Q56_04770 [Intoshia linei]|uniref:40S ribosomal protein S4 n=1 Tax=Intoshia linei TaxID=1819745 RepID=A0A177B024_9BILA|nr:hypothetical protein A3Q56_04770 [Intoshia linei]